MVAYTATVVIIPRPTAIQTSIDGYLPTDPGGKTHGSDHCQNNPDFSQRIYEDVKWFPCNAAPVSLTP